MLTIMAYSTPITPSPENGVLTTLLLWNIFEKRENIMDIRRVPLGQLNPARYNPRRDLQPGDPEYDSLKRSLLTFDLVEPLVWNERTGNLVGGHQRLKVLRELGHAEVEVSVVDLPASREKALNLALNRIQGEWDLPKLKDLLQELDTGELDMAITGFGEREIEGLMTWFKAPELGPELDESLAAGMSLCVCPECGNEHARARR